MKKKKPVKEFEPDGLPFSFLKVDVDDEKIKAHWDKIKLKIDDPSAKLADGEENNNTLNNQL